MHFPERIKIREVSPRDGLQGEAKLLPTDAKVELVNMLSRAGFSQVNVTSFVNPARVPAMADAAEVMARIERRPGVVYDATVPNLKGAQRAIDAGADALVTFVAASEAANQSNVGRGTEQALGLAEQVIGAARAAGIGAVGTISSAFGSPYGEVIGEADVTRLARRFADAGATGLALGDTSDPAKVRDKTLTIHREVLKHMRNWQEQGLGCKVSINLEATLLSDTGFCSQLADLCRNDGIAASSVVYEMTERQMPEDLSLIIENVARLRMAGFGVALDDFGTGAANFEILRSCPFSEVKLDRSLVCDPSPEVFDRLSAVVDLAHRAGIRVVAEGIETDADLARVRRLGCDRGQGYLLARPMPRDEVIRLLRQPPRWL